jgi:hypothetical protein
MDLPDYLLTRPEPPPLDPAAATAFDDLLDRALQGGPGEPIDYRLDEPKWQFLCHVADGGDIVLHGSGEPDIACFEPRRSNDLVEFGNRAAVHAAADGLWPMYFAVLDRRVAVSLTNTCLRVEFEDGTLSDPVYFFSVNREVVEQRRWRTGTIYLLPADGFEREKPYLGRGARIYTAQVASLAPVEPLAKLTIEPEDFPFLGQIRGHDREALAARIAADPDGFPWLD